LIVRLRSLRRSCLALGALMIRYLRGKHHERRDLLRVCSAWYAVDGKEIRLPLIACEKYLKRTCRALKALMIRYIHGQHRDLPQCVCVCVVCVAKRMETQSCPLHIQIAFPTATLKLLTFNTSAQQSQIANSYSNSLTRRKSRIAKRGGQTNRKECADTS
jgi:hypothetical protein